MKENGVIENQKMKKMAARKAAKQWRRNGVMKIAGVKISNGIRKRSGSENNGIEAAKV